MSSLLEKLSFGTVCVSTHCCPFICTSVALTQNHLLFLLKKKDNPNITVTYEHFPSCLTGNTDDSNTRVKPTIGIVNSPANTRFVGRYYACLMAKSPVCLFQDDDVYVWQMRTLYSQFLRYPNNLHTITLSEVFHYESMYSFHNATLGIHSGFAMVGFGGIVKQSIVAQFMNTMTALKLSSEKISLFCDVYLPLLMNQHKYSMSSQVSVIEQKHSFGTDAVAVDNTKELFWMMKNLLMHWDKTVELFNNKKRRKQAKAAAAASANPTAAATESNKKKKKQAKPLRTASPFLKLETTDWIPLPERNARSTCVSDECIFISNLNPFDYVYDQGFPLYGSKKRYAVAGNATCRADTYFARAVDLNPQSSWKSSACHSHAWEKIAKRGVEDPYIGLDLLKNRLVSSVTLALNSETDCVKTNAIKFFVARSEDINKATGNVEKWHPFSDFAVATPATDAAAASVPAVTTATYSKWIQKGAKPEHEDDDDDEEDEDEEDEKKYDQVQVHYNVNTYTYTLSKPQEFRFIKLSINKDDAVCSKALEVHELQAQFNKPQVSLTKLLRELMKGKHVDVYEE